MSYIDYWAFITLCVWVLIFCARWVLLRVLDMLGWGRTQRRAWRDSDDSNWVLLPMGLITIANAISTIALALTVVYVSLS